MSRSARKREQARMRGTHPVFAAIDEAVTVRFLGEVPTYEHYVEKPIERPVSAECAAGDHAACSGAIPTCWCIHHSLSVLNIEMTPDQTIDRLASMLGVSADELRREYDR